MTTPKVPQSKLPPKERDIPTVGLRVHLDTFRELDAGRFPGETWDLYLRRLYDHWQRSGPPASKNRRGMDGR